MDGVRLGTSDRIRPALEMGTTNQPVGSKFNLCLTREVALHGFSQWQPQPLQKHRAFS